MQRSQNLRGKGDKDMCTLDQTLRLWHLCQTPQLPKSESASRLNDSSWWHLRLQNGGDARKGEPWGMIITILPYATFQMTGLKGSIPDQLLSFLLPSCPLFLPSGFMRLWEDLELHFFLNVDWPHLNLLCSPSPHYHYLYKPMFFWGFFKKKGKIWRGGDKNHLSALHFY